MPEFIFDREGEIDSLRRRIGKRQSFLLYGPSGVGKTLLLKRVLPEFPYVLYSPKSVSPQTVFRNLAVALLGARAGDQSAEGVFQGHARSDWTPSPSRHSGG